MLISFKKPISILSSLSPVHAVAPNGKFVGVEITKRREGEPVQLPPCQGHEPRVKKETVSPPAKTLFVPIFIESLLAALSACGQSHADSGCCLLKRLLNCCCADVGVDDLADVFPPSAIQSKVHKRVFPIADIRVGHCSGDEAVWISKERVHLAQAEAR